MNQVIQSNHPEKDRLQETKDSAKINVATSFIEGVDTVIYEDRMYSTLLDWWKSYKVSPVPKEHLKSPSIGLVFQRGKELLAAVWLYEFKPVSIMADHIIVSPKLKGKDRESIIDLLRETGEMSARHLGYGDIYFYATNTALINRFEKEGYLTNNATILRKAL